MPHPSVNHGCAVCGRTTSLWCSDCQNIWYCSPDHMRADWPYHRLECHSTSADGSNMIATPPTTEPEYISGHAILFSPDEDHPRIIKSRPPQRPPYGVCPFPFPQPYAEGQTYRLPFRHPSPFHEDSPYSSGNRPLGVGDTLTTPMLHFDSQVNLDEPGFGAPPNYAYANSPSMHHPLEARLFPSSVGAGICSPPVVWIDTRQTVLNPDLFSSCIGIPPLCFVPGPASIPPPMRSYDTDSSYHSTVCPPLISPLAALPERWFARLNKPSSPVTRNYDAPGAAGPSFLDGFPALQEESMQDNVSPDCIFASSGLEGITGKNSGQRNISGGTGGNGGSGGVVGGNGGIGMGPMFGGISIGAATVVICGQRP
ncbi:hypothetical protein K438DRAFT_281776 [Mycena galopus ATCC 62051]|nr:hypothetical protein K438DRAFT_281776 [Mycena galopus ATCC 62051]